MRGASVMKATAVVWLVAIVGAPAMAATLIKWTGPGWYVDHDFGSPTAHSYGLWAGPFPNRPTCEAARTQWASSGLDVACDYHSQDPQKDSEDWDKMMGN